MKNVLQTRLIHWKKQIFSIIFWLCLPSIATIGIIHIANSFQQQVQIPIGIVSNEQTDLANELLEKITASPLLQVRTFDDKEVALHQLETHELDSVFIIKKGYEEQIRKGKRNQLLESYQSDLSFAYSTVKEMIVSYVQQETGRSKAAYAVKNLVEQYKTNNSWTWDEIVAKSRAIQQEEQLFKTSFHFANSVSTSEQLTSVLWMPKTWNVWAIFTILSTFLLFDWVVKERSVNLAPRMALMKYSYRNYLLKNGLFYMCLLSISAVAAILLFAYYLNEQINLSFVWTIFSYQLMVALGAFLIANCFKNTYFYYGISFALTLLLAIGSGSVLSITTITAKYNWIAYVNPLDRFLNNKSSVGWVFMLILITLIWYRSKGERGNA